MQEQASPVVMLYYPVWAMLNFLRGLDYFYAGASNLLIHEVKNNLLHFAQPLVYYDLQKSISKNCVVDKYYLGNIFNYFVSLKDS